MYDLTTAKPAIDKLRLRRTIIDHIGKTVDIEYTRGYIADGAFVESETDNVCLCNRPADTDENGKVTVPEKREFDDAMKVFATAKTPDGFAIDRLRVKDIIKKEEITK
jgi:hypothetical protein